jgi:hypothetical protein
MNLNLDIQNTHLQFIFSSLLSYSNKSINVASCYIILALGLFTYLLFYTSLDYTILKFKIPKGIFTNPLSMLQLFAKNLANHYL